jgi:GH25 family lysozyme M1 (1,4-beta-N-acetylmuramidase)
MPQRAIDVSKWDTSNIVGGVSQPLPVNWQKARDDSGIALAIIKASEGLAEDPGFQMQWKATKGILPRMAYHYFRPNINAIQAAVAFVSSVKAGGFDPATDFIALDFESKPLLMTSNAMMLAAASWLYEVEKALGVNPMFYTGYYFWLENGGAKQAWGARHPLWLAQYPYDKTELYSETDFTKWRDLIDAGALKPKVPTPWTTPAIWQITARAKPESISGYPLGEGHKLAVDFNFVYRDLPVIGAPAVRYCPTCGQVWPIKP